MSYSVHLGWSQTSLVCYLCQFFQLPPQTGEQYVVKLNYQQLHCKCVIELDVMSCKDYTLKRTVAITAKLVCHVLQPHPSRTIPKGVQQIAKVLQQAN